MSGGRLTCGVLTGVALATATAAMASLAVAQDRPAVVISEVLASHTGPDDTEYVELSGPAGTSLAGLSLIVVEGDATGPGTIDRRIDFAPGDHLGDNGFFLIGNPAGLGARYAVVPDRATGADLLENSSLTLALVETASVQTGAPGAGEVVLDAIGLSDGGAGDRFFFGAPVIGPDGRFMPAGARRGAKRVEAEGAVGFALADFDLGPANTPTAGHGVRAEPLVATVMAIQGAGPVSPLAGQLVETTGIVTLRGERGFWLQDPVGDGDDETSDGLLVAGRPAAVAPGDRVRVIGTVEEQRSGRALPLTRIRAGRVAVISSGHEPPAPVELVRLPGESVGQAILFWERLEGMLVEARDGWVVAPTSKFGEFAFVAAANAESGSGFRVPTRQLFLGAKGQNQVDYNPERILVDDASLGEPILTRPGDRVRYLSGVVDYSFGNYKIQPGQHDLEPGSAAPASGRQGERGDLTVTSFNLENLFDSVDEPGKADGDSNLSPAALAIKLAKLQLALEDELNLPEILVVQEIENTAVLQMLGDRVNASGGTSYAAVSFESSDRRGIEVGLLYDQDRVTLIDAFQLGTGPSAALAARVAEAFGQNSRSPGREPLVGQFAVGDETLWVIANHFKSKGGDAPVFGTNSLNGEPPERASEAQRKLQARVVRDAVDLLFDQSGDQALIIVAGDLNDFPFGEPGEGDDHPLAVLEGLEGRAPLTNLVNLERPAERFSFLFDGNSQVLDHLLASPALLDRLRGIDAIHFNASFPAHLAGDPSTSNRSSDHDPVEARFAFPGLRLAGR